MSRIAAWLVAASTAGGAFKLGTNRRVKTTSSALALGLGMLLLTPASAQEISASTIAPPTPTFPVEDENGVTLATNALQVVGPSLSIGNPQNGGLFLQPNIAGADAISFSPPCTAYCVETGFTGASTNLSISLTGQPRWENIPLNATPLTVYSSRGTAHYYALATAPTTFIEYSPQIGRPLTYTTGAPPAYSGDTGERVTFQDSDGTKYVFLYLSQQPAPPKEPITAFPILQIIKPTGETTTFSYDGLDLRAISNNRGYMIKFQNGTFSMGTSPNNVNPVNTVVAVNLAIEQCSASAAICNLSHSWPMLTGGRFGLPGAPDSAQVFTSPRTYKDPLGSTTSVSWTWPASPTFTMPVTVTRPNGRIENYVFDYTHNLTSPISPIQNCPQAPGQVSLYSPNWNPIWTFPCPFTTVTSVNNGGTSWTYKLDFNYSAIAASPGNYYVSSTVSTRTDQNGKTKVVNALPSGQVTRIQDELGRVTTVDVQPLFDANEGRINRITFPLLNSKSYTYDTRGNVTSEVEAPPPGSSLSNLITSYVFPSTCTNWNICNKPTSKTDPKGNVTHYTWDPSSGQISTITSPPDSSGLSAEKRYFYTQLYAWLSNGAGGYQQAASPIWMLAQERTCRTTATVGNACAGGSADEIVTDYYYGPPSGPNNLELRGVAITADGIIRRTCYSYDSLGHRISETRPNANLAVCP